MPDNFKTDMTVSESLARSLLEAGVSVLTYVPGFGANEIFTDYNRAAGKSSPVSFHEEVAYSIAHGAGLAGARSATLMKSHGFIKAGNSVSDSLYAGTTAGVVAVIVSDKTGKQSDSILDIESFLRGTGIPYQALDRADIGNQIKYLYAQSEKRSLPYALIVESKDVLEQAAAKNHSAAVPNIPVYSRDITRHVLCPFFVDYQSQVLKLKNSLQDWKSLSAPEIPHLPEGLPDKWKPAAAAYQNLFTVFRTLRGPLVVGDTGISALFACEPYNCIDITTYMGGSIPLATGAYLAGTRDVWAVTGDFSFIAAGHLGLLEALQRGIPLKVLIFYNGKAETTGGQIIPENILETVLSGYSRYILRINNPDDPAEVESVLNEAKNVGEMRIVVADYRKKR